ncbi:MAG: SGNH/GDSL hydrolase family protein [Actinomycetota bacterium]
MKKTLAFLMAISLLFSLAVISAGCGGDSGTGESETQVTEQTTPSEESGARGDVTMCGRSVMYGWLQHWGYQGSGTVGHDGYTFDYRELDGSNMVGSFKDAVGGLPAGSPVFFKFCFVDFDGSNLAEREEQVDEVVAFAREKGLKLVIGNALPVHEQDAPDGILDEYRSFNEFLEQKAASNPDVWVYDFYGVLAGPDGFLKAEYDTGDSHPNDEAYTELDVTFFPLLGTVSAR